MAEWSGYIFAFIAFFLSHSIPVRSNVKARIVKQSGPLAFTFGYSVLSTIMLIWVIVAANRAPIIELWRWQPWQNHLTLLCMLLAVVIASLAVGRPNPLSFGGANNTEFDPDHPGIVGWFRHPLLVALLLWASGHLVPNGNLAHVILFSVFATFAVIGARIIDRRNRRILGDETWAALARTKRKFQVTGSGLARTVGAGALYALLIWLHGPVIGAYPLP